jgi:hypothetical protein
LDRSELGERRRELVDRISPEVRVGDMRLDAADGQAARKRSAAAVADRVAERILRRRLADDAIVDSLAARLEPLDDADRAVDRRAFFVRSQQKRDRAGVARALGNEGLDRDDERGDRGLHVGAAAAEKPAVAQRRDERVAVPLRKWPRRDDVRVAGKAQQGGPVAAPRPQVVDFAEAHRLGAKAGFFEPPGEKRLAAAVFGGYRAAADEFLREFENALQRATARSGRHVDLDVAERGFGSLRGEVVLRLLRFGRRRRRLTVRQRAGRSPG